MKKTFFIFRHGETNYNSLGIVQGSKIDAPLNKKGVEQAYAIAEKLAPENIQMICSSYLLRASGTAKILAGFLDNLPIEQMEDLCEANLGIVEGWPYERIARTFPKLWGWLGEDVDLNGKYPEGETRLETQKRMVRAFDEMLELPAQQIAVCSHAVSLKFLFLAWGHKLGKLEHGKIWKFVHEDDKWTFEAEL